MNDAISESNPTNQFKYPSPFYRDEDAYSTESSNDMKTFGLSTSKPDRFICLSDDDDDDDDDDSSLMSEAYHQNEDSVVESVSSHGDDTIDFSSHLNDDKKSEVENAMEISLSDKIIEESKDQRNDARKKLSATHEAFGQSDDIALTCEKIEKVMNKLKENIETITDIQDVDKLSLMVTLNSIIENDVLVTVTPNLLKIILENRELTKKIERLN